jgi:hypothetical protein
VSKKQTPEEIQATIDAARERATAAAKKHPHAVDPNKPPEVEQDADDIPVYSRKQFERMLAANVVPGAAAAQASQQTGGLQQASFPALMRELLRRREEAQTKLAGIPTELLELELERRSEDK